jgi:hypothetical protein
LKLVFTRNYILKGALIYASGDTIASFILNNFSWHRLAGIMLIGATLYAFEIPNYFSWIDKRTNGSTGFKSSVQRTVLAILYFNPLWIARHLFFIELFSFRLSGISWNIFRIASLSFLVNIPISILANFIIQNKIALKWRFLASAVFSALMAIYYAVSKVLFS